MARSSGRQTRATPLSSAPSTSAAPRPKKGSQKLKKSAKGTEKEVVALDVYEYASGMKGARGDVDPEARAGYGDSSKRRKGKGKGKARQDPTEEGGDEVQDEEDEEQAMFRSGEIVEFNGVKPAGLWMGGGDAEEGNFDSEDDEDINSDDAFEEEDDLPRKSNEKKGKPSRKVVEIDLDEEEIDFEDEEGAAYMDASEMLDAGDYDSKEDSADSDIPSGSDEEMDDQVSLISGSDRAAVELDSEEDSEVDEEYEGALLKLGSFVEGLESKKRKAEEAGEEGTKKKRVVLKERTEAFPEGEFVAVSGPDGVAESKINLDDLLASFAGSKNPKLAALRKTLKPLAAASSASSSTKSGSLSHLKSSGPLAAPLPARLQDKIEREAGYEKTKEETDKWNATVRRMKGESGIGVEGARHERLVLPLVGGAGNVLRDPNASEWSAKFQPTNEMEASIQALLLAGQMSTSDLQKAEKDALAALDPADVVARQAELRQQRDLMFRAERKAKRVSKIKSKAFRRIHRKEKGKNGLTLEDMEEMDKLDGGDRVTEEKAKMEIARAKERVTLKHSTQGGRWSKTVGGIQGLDEERNTAVRDMVARKDQLRKRIIGEGDNGGSDDEFGGDSEDEEDDQDASLDQIRRTAFEELASLDRKEAEANSAAGPLKSKSVLNMKFMKDALARDQRKVQNSADELRRKLEGMEQAGADFEMELEEVTGASAQVEGNLGRMVFGPSGSAQASTSAPAKSSSQTTTKLSAPLAIPIVSSSRPSFNRSPLSLGVPAAASTSENPWLALDEGQPDAGKISRKMNKATVSKDSQDSARSAAKVDRHKAKMADVREAEKDDATVEIDPSIVLAVAKAPRQPELNAPAPMKKTKKVANAKTTLIEDGVGSSDEEDDELQVEAQRGRGPAAFKQRDLVAQAFAGDNVVADFEAEKRKEIERDAPKEQDNTLPGWGGWGGKGVKKARNAKKFITKIAGVEPAARKDAAFSNVIISEKKDKRAAKYQLKDLPFPYTSPAQYEQRLRTPLGPEWSTATILRDQTLPKILIKPGVTIRPLGHRDA